MGDWGTVEMDRCKLGRAVGVDQHLVPGEAGALFDQRLLYDRNTRMLERMQPQLKAGNSFVAVGALHLYGDKGLLAQLAREGYKVTRVY